MNTFKSLAMAVVLATATTGLVGCAGNRYKQSTGEHIDDTATTARVKQELARDDMYKYPDVKVATFKGTVQLSGFVEGRQQRQRAGELAQHVQGVKDVVNNITIKD